MRRPVRGAAREQGRAAITAVTMAYRAAPPAVWAAAVTAVLGAVAPVASAQLTRVLLDRIGGAGPGGTSVLGLAVALALAGVALALAPQLEQYVRGEIDRSASLVGTDRLYRAVDRLVGLARFEDPDFQDRLRMAEQGTRSPGAVLATGLAAARSVLTLVGFLGSLLAISLVVTLAVAVAAVPTVIAQLALSRRRTEMLRDISPAQRRELFYSSLLLRPDAAQEIRLFGTGRVLRRRMLSERRGADRARRRMDRRDLATQGGLATLAAAVAGAGLVWMVHSAAGGRYTVGEVSLFVAAVAGTQAGLSGLVTHVATGHERLLTFRYLTDLLAEAPDLPVRNAGHPVPALRRGLEFDDVWFRYSDDHPWTLRGVTLFVPQGCALALVGRNGAGKTTLLRLACRLYDPTRGTVRWDGTDLRELDPALLRKRLGAVFQDFLRYDLTAAENIGLGDGVTPDDRHRVVRAATRAGVHEVIERLPAGYDTLLSRMFAPVGRDGDPTAGVQLSGGQWQRLALARAMMRPDPDLVLLDEPSAGLDADAEGELHAVVRSWRAGRTSVLVSHRLSTVRDADVIAVLADGVVTEQGHHAQLMALDGTYAELFRRQATGYLDDPQPDAGRAAAPAPSPRPA